MKNWLVYWSFWAFKKLSVLNLLNIQKVTHCNFRLKNLLYYFVLANILILRSLEKSHTLYQIDYTLLRDLVWVYQTQTSNLFIVTKPVSGCWELEKVRKTLLGYSLERLVKDSTQLYCLERLEKTTRL